MFHGTTEMIEILNKSTKYLVYLDPDVDGLIAGYFVYTFLMKNNIKPQYYVNENRQHGFFLDADKLAGYTVIAVDFSMTPGEVKALVDKGVNLINIDHHDMEDYSSSFIKYEKDGYTGIVINNQYAFEDNNMRFLSGAGVVFYVLAQLGTWFNNEENTALMGISLLTDIRQIEDNQKLSSSILNVTYNSQSDKIRSLIQFTKGTNDFSFGLPCMDRNFVDYSFSPKMNALFRLNMGDTAIKLIFGVRDLSVDLDSLRLQQNKIIDDMITKLHSQEYSNLSIKSLDEYNFSVRGNYDPANFIGVACSRVKGAGNSTIVFLEKDGVIRRGSFRGRFDKIDYLSILKKNGLTCRGHSNAFGILATELSKIDFGKLNDDIAEAEFGAEMTEYKNRVFETSNFSATARCADKVAVYNIYVRDANRIYYKYVGKNWECKQRGKMWEYIIDGISIKCFDEGITPDNGFILPLYNKGYITYYLKKLSIRRDIA